MKPHIGGRRTRMSAPPKGPSLNPTTQSILIRYRTESTTNPNENVLNFQRFLPGFAARRVYFTLQKLVVSWPLLIRVAVAIDSPAAGRASLPPAPARLIPARHDSPACRQPSPRKKPSHENRE